MLPDEILLATFDRVTAASPQSLLSIALTCMRTRDIVADTALARSAHARDYATHMKCLRTHGSPDGIINCTVRPLPENVTKVTKVE